ncbi:hypothetical protein MIR68_011510 [Amoeboaphelidium protococcarum]|nr:hypothetical protein MIR68_011510 [Amoeboaphelidium protococcarum]
MVTDAYLKYYGPLLTAARIKEHAYLQLKSKEDSYFFYETSKRYSALFLLMADNDRDDDDTLFHEWILAVEHFYSITDCQREMIDSDDDDDEELPYGYNVLRWKIKFESEEVLTSSQLDLITIMFQQYRSYFTSPVQQRTSPHVSLYGYYHDALRQYWLDAMISVINLQCDVVFDEKYEVEYFRTMESSEEICEDPVDFVFTLCLYFGFGSCDYVREQLERRLEIAPSFSALLAYFNLLDLQYLNYNLDLEAYLKSFVLNILNNHECTNMQSLSLELFRINSSKMLISCNLTQLLERKLSVKWVLKQIAAVKVVHSVDFGWLVLSLMNLYKSAGSGARLCQKISLSKLSKGRVDEAFNMLVAILSSKQCSELKWDEERMSEHADSTLVEVLVKLLNCQIIVINPDFFPFAKIFYSFRKVLVGHRQRLILLALIQFSRAHRLKMFQCSSYHAGIKEIVQSLGGALEFASIFLQLDAGSLSKLSECIYTDVINHFFPSYDQQLLDKISVHMIEQYCRVQSMDLKILAFYFKEFLEHSFYSEVAMLKLRQVLSHDQLKVFCSEFDEDQIAALHLGDQFQEPWIIEVERISKQVCLSDTTPLFHCWLYCNTLCLCIQIMSQLVNLLALPQSPLYQYLRPVDFLQLSKCNKECQDAIVNQKYKLQSEEDYVFFFHEQIKSYHALLTVVSPIMCFVTRDLISPGLRLLDGFIEKAKLSSGEVLASSQIDFLCILYRAFVKRKQQVSDPKRKPCRVSKYGYYHDAVKNFQLDAMVKIINTEFDVLIEEVNIINSDRLRQGRSATISGKADAFSQLRQYFQLGSCDDVREQYNHSTVQKHLDEYVVRIVDNPLNVVLQQYSVGFSKHTRDKYLISTQMQSLLKLYLSYYWVKQKIKDVKVVQCVETGWAILSIFKTIDPAQSESTYQKLVYGKLCRCRTDEAMYLILAAYCYDVENPFQWKEQEMSPIAIKTLVRVLEQLLDIKFVVRESKFFQLGCIFKSFKESLVGHQQHLMRVSMLKFSQVGHVDIDSCCYSHDYMQWIIGCLDGPIEWAHVLLNSDANYIARLKGCIIVIGLFPDLDHLSQSMLDQVSVHLVNLFCGNEKLDFHNFACYFQHLREMSLYAEEAVLKLKQIGSDQELIIICKMVPDHEDIVVMNFGSQFRPGWINEQLALGFFQHIQWHDTLPEKQVSLIQMFFTEAKYARADVLVCEVERLIKEFYGCKMEALLGDL